MPTEKKSLLDRFMSRVTRGPGCWTHSGSLGSHGYPQATGPAGWSGPAHRIGWLLQVGPIPPGMMVLHNCNNKLCVRLDHLRIGTHKENMDDMARVGHVNRKLTSEHVVAIRHGTAPQRTLGARYGISQRAVQFIKRGVTYRHVTESARQLELFR